MSALNRQEQIIEMLKISDSPVSGNTLSETFGVSRQIIVKDINSLKENGYEIISTPKGYILDHSHESVRIFKVHHTPEETEDELNLIVDLGARIKDVFIYHRVYGEIHAPLNIRSRRDIELFCNDIKNGHSSLLMNTTGGYHFHTVAADDDNILTLVEEALKNNGFLAPLTDYEPKGLTK